MDWNCLTGRRSEKKWLVEKIKKKKLEKKKREDKSKYTIYTFKINADLQRERERGTQGIRLPRCLPSIDGRRRWWRRQRRAMAMASRSDLLRWWANPTRSGFEPWLQSASTSSAVVNFILSLFSFSSSPIFLYSGCSVCKLYTLSWVRVSIWVRV